MSNTILINKENTPLEFRNMGYFYNRLRIVNEKLQQPFLKPPFSRFIEEFTKEVTLNTLPMPFDSLIYFTLLLVEITEASNVHKKSFDTIEGEDTLEGLCN